MFMQKFFAAAIVAGAAVVLPASANATTFSEGFEGSSYNFYADTGATAETSTALAHSGSQSVYFSIPTGPNYARVEVPAPGGYTLQNLTSASFWVNRVGTDTELTPYLIIGLSCATCDGGAYAGADIIAIQNIGSVAANTWTDIAIDPNTTSFHLYDNNTSTNIVNPTTLAGLYTDWGTADIDYFKIAYGLAGGNTNGATYQVYADDLSVGLADVVAVPLPGTLPLFVGGLGVLGLVAWRRKKSQKVCA